MSQTKTGSLGIGRKKLGFDRTMDPEMSSDEVRNSLVSLQKYGFVVLKGVVDLGRCAEISTALTQLEKTALACKDAGIDFDKHHSVIWNPHYHFPELLLPFVNLRRVMDVVRQVLQERVVLNVFSATRPLPEQRNNVHIDSRIPISKFENTIQMLAMICVQDFTTQNGATRVWPFSHLTGSHPRSIEQRGTALPGAIQVEADAGDVILFLGQTWHEVSPWHSGSERWGLIAYYSRWWVKPYFDYRYCGEEIFSRLSAEQKELFGFTSAPPRDAIRRNLTLTEVEDLPAEYSQALNI